MSGKLITPKEAAVIYRRENEPMDTELVTFPTTKYFPHTTPDEKEIEDFYTKRQADYRMPDRIQVYYIEFIASNYLAKAEKHWAQTSMTMLSRTISRRAPRPSRMSPARNSAPMPPRRKSKTKSSSIAP